MGPLFLGSHREGTEPLPTTPATPTPIWSRDSLALVPASQLTALPGPTLSGSWRASPPLTTAPAQLQSSNPCVWGCRGEPHLLVPSGCVCALSCINEMAKGEMVWTHTHWPIQYMSVACCVQGLGLGPKGI